MDVKILNIWDIQDEYKDVLICNQAEVDLLAKNISEIGLIQPVVIAPDNRLICGRKRLAALKIIGANTVPCVVNYGNYDAVLYSENAVRFEANLYNEAVFLNKLLSKYNNIQALADALGISYYLCRLKVNLINLCESFAKVCNKNYIHYLDEICKYPKDIQEIIYIDFWDGDKINNVNNIYEFATILEKKYTRSLDFSTCGFAAKEQISGFEACYFCPFNSKNVMGRKGGICFNPQCYTAKKEYIIAEKLQQFIANNSDGIVFCGANNPLYLKEINGRRVQFNGSGLYDFSTENLPNYLPCLILDTPAGAAIQKYCKLSINQQQQEFEAAAAGNSGNNNSIDLKKIESVLAILEAARGEKVTLPNMAEISEIRVKENAAAAAVAGQLITIQVRADLSIKDIILYFIYSLFNVFDLLAFIDERKLNPPTVAIISGMPMAEFKEALRAARQGRTFDEIHLTEGDIWESILNYLRGKEIYNLVRFAIKFIDKYHKKHTHITNLLLKNITNEKER